MSGSGLRAHILLGGFGLLMGMSLTRIGFADYGELHRMFVFADLRLLFTFMGGVAVTFIGFLLLGRLRHRPHKPLHKGTIGGGLVFGIGWAITGACPSVALVQLGHGHLPALATMVGIAVGVWTYRRMHERHFQWDTGACDA